MARPSAAARNLSLTEELEKLEQSITLTLQEIDHNFSKAHRIVTTSILPIVEQYGDNSRAIWDASKFWKQFFEASANVSLSGYEEPENDNETTVGDESSALRDDSEANDYTDRPHYEEDVTATPGANRSTAHGEESMLDEGDITGSTPRAPASRTMQSTEYADLESPYESMRREMKAEEDQPTVLHHDDDDDEEESEVLFAQRTAQLPDMSLMSPQVPLQQRLREQKAAHGNKDPLLHRILDKNYRLQTTPHKPPLRMSPLKATNEKQRAPAWQDSPMSSPEIAIPKLRSTAFMSPYKSAAGGAARGPKTPGVSVQTPRGTARKTRDVFAEDSARPTEDQSLKQKYEIDWDSDEDGDGDLYAGMSPPKTIQFALPPSKLLQTPAREASRRIVDDILLDAGADPESSEYSPTMVKMNEDVLNDSF